jgi:hypothetical protein
VEIPPSYSSLTYASHPLKEHPISDPTFRYRIWSDEALLLIARLLQALLDIDQLGYILLRIPPPTMHITCGTHIFYPITKNGRQDRNDHSDPDRDAHCDHIADS